MKGTWRICKIVANHGQLGKSYAYSGPWVNARLPCVCVFVCVRKFYKKFKYNGGVMENELF